MNLDAPMHDGALRLEAIVEAHREPLRAACALDEEIWTIYATRFFGEDFDAAFEMLLDPARGLALAILDDGRLVGTSSFVGTDTASRNVEIGRTYLIPDVRGTGLNRRVDKNKDINMLAIEDAESLQQALAACRSQS